MTLQGLDKVRPLRESFPARQPSDCMTLHDWRTQTPKRRRTLPTEECAVVYCAQQTLCTGLPGQREKAAEIVE